MELSRPHSRQVSVTSHCIRIRSTGVHLWRALNRATAHTTIVFLLVKVAKSSTLVDLTYPCRSRKPRVAEVGWNMEGR